MNHAYIQLSNPDRVPNLDFAASAPNRGRNSCLLLVLSIAVLDLTKNESEQTWKILDADISKKTGLNENLLYRYEMNLKP